MSDSILVLDVARLLDASQVGQKAAAELAKRFEVAKKQRKALKAKAEAAEGAAREDAEHELSAFEAKEIRALEEARGGLRHQLLARAQPHVIRLLKERGADVVLRAEELVVFKRDLDITDLVIEAVDKEGALKA
jgi:Skp family chaperone for outer membrane proteins